MTPERALAMVRELAAARRISLTKHARERMRPAPLGRGCSFADLCCALSAAVRCEPSADDPGRWIVAGADLDGDDLSAVVVILDGLLVITLF